MNMLRIIRAFGWAVWRAIVMVFTPAQKPCAMNFFQRLWAALRGKEQTRRINGKLYSTIRYPDGHFPDGKPKPPRGYIVMESSPHHWHEVAK